jgi:GxxExxY protein
VNKELVEDTIVVELKTVKNIHDIFFVIVRSCLKATGKNHGLILNFAKASLEVKRVICEWLFPPYLHGFLGSL